jgi:hypothetical protein
MRRPAAARKTLGRGPLVKTGRAYSSRIERVPLVATTAKPVVVFEGRPATEWTPDAGIRGVEALVLINVAIKNHGEFQRFSRHDVPAEVDGEREAPPLEKWQRHIEKSRFARLEFKFLPAVPRWTARPELSFSRSSFGLRCYHHPGPTFWTGDARARNAIGHIEIVLQPRPGPFACDVNDSSLSAICLVV